MSNRESKRRTSSANDERALADAVTAWLGLAASAETAATAIARPGLAASAEAADMEDEEPAIWTFRVMLLGSISFLFLLVFNKYFVREKSESIMGMLSMMVVLYILGYIMGKLIPKRMVYYPKLGLEFSINQGPFGLKEFALISILANLGATIGGFNSHHIDFC